MNYLGLDVGTTRCKCQLFSDTGEILSERSCEYAFLRKEGEYYADLRAIREKAFGLIGEIAREYVIDSICISSFGESFVLLGRDDEVLFDPMLYTDPRGKEEAEEILRTFGKEIFFATGVVPQSMFSLSKLLWIKKHAPDALAKAEKLLLICDYLGYLLTGERIIDYALAARTGAFNLTRKNFDEGILNSFSIDRALFSRPMPAGSIVGEVKADLKKELGIKGKCTVVLGSHDQVCAALGAGAISEGDAVDGMGTVECLTVLFRERPQDIRMGEQGYVVVPYAVGGLYCTYMLNYSCGSLVNWYRKKLLHGYRGAARSEFEYLESQMKEEPTGILLLPYFGGAATPYQNVDAKGAIVNLTLSTGDADIYRAIMEGTAMEMRLNAETAKRYGIKVKHAVATGGCANSEKWLQLKADIQNISVSTLRSSEGGLCGCAMLSALAMGSAKSWEEAKRTFVREKAQYFPHKDRYLAYESQYRKYRKLYQTLKETEK